MKQYVLIKDTLKGLWKENPVFRQLLGMCPTLAVTNAAILSTRLCARKLNKNNATLRKKHLWITGKKQNTYGCGMPISVGGTHFKEKLTSRKHP